MNLAGRPGEKKLVGGFVLHSILFSARRHGSASDRSVLPPESISVLHPAGESQEFVVCAESWWRPGGVILDSSRVFSIFNTFCAQLHVG